jgi:hypothetical protein
MEVDMLVELTRPHAFDFTIVLALKGGWRGRRARRGRRHDGRDARRWGRCVGAGSQVIDEFDMSRSS